LTDNEEISIENNYAKITFFSEKVALGNVIFAFFYRNLHKML